LPPEQFLANLGYCYLIRSRKDSAIYFYKQAIGINPNQSEYHFNVGYLLSSRDQSDSSIKYLRRARELAADPTKTSYLLGCRLMDKPNRSHKETAEGIELLREYLSCGDGEALKTSKAREKISQAGAQP
jgi:tetratricopeptide (TPR) repeat protein